MAQATVQTQHGGILSKAATEEISVQALWEGAWPTKLANTILPPFVVLMRLTMGWIFLYSGLDKLINGFSASVCSSLRQHRPRFSSRNQRTSDVSAGTRCAS